MVEKNEIPSENQSEVTDEAPDAAVELDQQPSLEEDFAMLEKINILKAVMIRMKSGRHPAPQIDALLKRRMNFSGDEFQGPYIVRLLSTLMMVFVISTLVWGTLWILASGFGLSFFTKVLSTGMATVVAAIAGISIFHPTSLPDENLLKQSIEQKFKELHTELQEINGDSTSKATETELRDANFESGKPATKEKGMPDGDILNSMPQGLEGMRPDEELKDDSLDSEGENTEEKNSVDQETGAEEKLD